MSYAFYACGEIIFLIKCISHAVHLKMFRRSNSTLLWLFILGMDGPCLCIIKIKILNHMVMYGLANYLFSFTIYRNL